MRRVISIPQQVLEIHKERTVCLSHVIGHEQLIVDSIVLSNMTRAHSLIQCTSSGSSRSWRLIRSSRSVSACLILLLPTQTRNSGRAEHGWIARCGWVPRRGLGASCRGDAPRPELQYQWRSDQPNPGHHPGRQRNYWDLRIPHPDAYHSPRRHEREDP